jgi:hypothetical protein
MNEVSKTFCPVTSPDIRSVISLPESASGVTRSAAPDGPTTDPFGQEVVPVNLFRALPEGGEELLMLGIYGPRGEVSSPSTNLQSSLENRLVLKMADIGSLEYALTWKPLDMPSGPPICVLRGSVRRTSGRDFTGWVTTSARDWKDTPGMSTQAVNPDGTKRMRVDQLGRQAAQIVGADSKPHGITLEKGGGLNPEHSRWLMGLPTGWDACAGLVTPLSRRKHKPS